MVRSVPAVLVREGHAVPYTGGSKEATQARHLENRKRLISENGCTIT